MSDTTKMAVADEIMDLSDGTIISVCHGEIDHHVTKHVYFQTPSGEVHSVPDTTLYRIFTSQKFLQMHQGKYLLPDAYELPVKRRKKFMKEMPDVAERILDGTVGMDVIINSLGGTTIGKECIKDLMRHVQENRGFVRALIGTYAHSAASVIALAADEINIPGSASLGLHSSISHDGSLPPEEQILSETQEDMNSLLEHVIFSQDEVQAKFKEAINDKDNPRNDVHFWGNDLQRFGAAPRSVKSIEDVIAILRKRYGSFMEDRSSPLGQDIRRFEEYTSIERKVRKATNGAVGIFINRRSKKGDCAYAYEVVRGTDKAAAEAMAQLAPRPSGK